MLYLPLPSIPKETCNTRDITLQISLNLPTLMPMSRYLPLYLPLPVPDVTLKPQKPLKAIGPELTGTLSRKCWAESRRGSWTQPTKKKMTLAPGSPRPRSAVTTATTISNVLDGAATPEGVLQDKQIKGAKKNGRRQHGLFYYVHYYYYYYFFFFFFTF